MGAIDRLDGFVARHHLIGFDTNILIYLIEDDARYASLSHRFFRHVEHGRAEALTSVITLAEALVQPYRRRNEKAVSAYRAFLRDYPHLRLLMLTPSVAVSAALLRGYHGVRLPDALQVAAAMEAGATGFLTNDRRLSALSEIEVLVLDDCLSSLPGPEN